MRVRRIVGFFENAENATTETRRRVEASLSLSSLRELKGAHYERSYVKGYKRAACRPSEYDLAKRKKANKTRSLFFEKSTRDK